MLKATFETVFVRLPLGREALPADFPYAVREGAGTVAIETTDVSDAMRRLVEHGVPLEHLQVETPTLEDLFLQLTGKGLRG